MVVLIVIMDLKPPLAPPKETGSATMDMSVEDVDEFGICVASGDVTGPVLPPRWIWVVVHVASGQPKGRSKS